MPTFDPTPLIAGDHPLTHRPVTIVSGQGKLARGTLLGRITSGGKYVKSLSASEDGSEKPVAILADDVDATSGDAVGPAYFEGEFFQEKVPFGASHTAASVNASFVTNGVNIYLRKAGAAA